MENNSQMTMTGKVFILNLISFFFGFIAFAIGVVNTFWGNDPGFGVLIIVLSTIYFPPIDRLFTEKTGFTIPRYLKILIGLFILWAALGVGELFDKIEMMLGSFS